MKKRLITIVFAIAGTLLFSYTIAAQNQHILSLKIQLRLHKYLDYSSDGKVGFQNSVKQQNRIKILEQTCSCTNFRDENKNGICDNSDGVGILDRTRLKDGKSAKRRGNR